MEVTRENFKEVLNEIDDVLKNAAFICIDGEFTGLNSGPDAGALVSPAQYYAKLRTNSMDFLLVQFGVSIFNYDEEEKKYSQHSYNFYVFPQPLNSILKNRRFMCQASSIAFLVEQGLDFNKIFKLGIPFMTSAEEEKLIKQLEEKQKVKDEDNTFITIPDADRSQIEDICDKIEKFLDSDNDTLSMDRCNSYIRRIIYHEARIRWPNRLRIEGKTNHTGQWMIIQKLGSKESEDKKERERQELEKQELQDAVGLSLLMRKIADSGKLIVGHNMLLDLCHIIRQFFGPLPEDYQEFKMFIHGLFPRILDTKIICQSQSFRETVSFTNLFTLFDTMKKEPFSIPDIKLTKNRSYSLEEEKTHEAGYDAYVTGLCFLALANYLESQHGNDDKPPHLNSSLEPFLNKLFIARLKDFPYINLVAPDPNPSRDHVFHITFPKEWKHNNLNSLFSPFGAIYVSWLNDTSAYVAILKRENASSVIKKIGKSTIYTIQKYADHQASLLKANLPGECKRKTPSPTEITNEDEEKTITGNKSNKNEGWEQPAGKRRRKRKRQNESKSEIKKETFAVDNNWN